MLIKTILNRVPRHSGFVYVAERWVETAAGATREVQLRARANSRLRCSGCRRAGAGYGTLAQRRFEFVPLWGIPVFFVYAPRRVNCRHCGVRVEALPWAVGKHRLTTAYAWFLARWAKRLSWKEVAEVFHTSWDHVFRAVEMAVDWGREHQDLGAITAIGVDELQWQRGHRYLTPAILNVSQKLGQPQILVRKGNGMSNRFLPEEFQSDQVIAYRATRAANTLSGGDAWRG